MHCCLDQTSWYWHPRCQNFLPAQATIGFCPSHFSIFHRRSVYDSRLFQRHANFLLCVRSSGNLSWTTEFLDVALHFQWTISATNFYLIRIRIGNLTYHTEYNRQTIGWYSIPVPTYAFRINQMPAWRCMLANLQRARLSRHFQERTYAVAAATYLCLGDNHSPLGLKGILGYYLGGVLNDRLCKVTFFIQLRVSVYDNHIFLLSAVS